MSDSPIMLVSSERSGSNLLRKLLANHSDICGPVAPHFLTGFASFSHHYGDLSEEENTRRLYSDMLQLANHPYHDWKLSSEFEDIWSTYRPRCLIAMVHALYSAKANSEGKARYCSKEINLSRYVSHIATTLPHSRFCYLVRDPRDHVASWMKRPINLFSPFDAVAAWIDEQEAVQRLRQLTGIPIVVIRYEDLVEDTPTIMRVVLEHVDAAVEPACFETTADGAPESEWNPHWKNLQNPVTTDSVGTFAEWLDPEDVEMIETLAWPIMRRFCYEPITRHQWKLSAAYGRKIFGQRQENRERRLAESPEMAERLDSKWELLKQFREQQQDLAPNDPAAALRRIRSRLERRHLGPRRRIRYLAYALLGERLASSVIRRMV